MIQLRSVHRWLREPAHAQQTVRKLIHALELLRRANESVLKFGYSRDVVSFQPPGARDVTVDQLHRVVLAEPRYASRATWQP